MSEILRDDLELNQIIYSGVAPCLPEGGAFEVSLFSSLKLTLRSFKLHHSFFSSSLESDESMCKSSFLSIVKLGLLSSF